MKKLPRVLFVLVAFALAIASCADGDGDETTAGGNEADSATVDEAQATETDEATPEDETALVDEAEGASDEADQAGSGEPGSDELCNAFVQLSSTSGGLAGAQPSDADETRASLEEFAAALENLENVADDPLLAADAAIVSTPMQEIIALYEAANWDLDAVTNDPEALVILASLTSPEVIESTERISEVGRTRCGIDLDA